MTKKKSILSLLVAFALIIPCAFIMTACGGKKKKGESDPTDPTAYKAKIEVPTVQTSTFTYDGTEKVLLTDGTNYIVLGGKATNAGSYTATLSLKDKTNCVWADNTNEDKTIAWTIEKQLVAIPTATSIFTYDGTQKTLPIPASQHYTVSGNRATNAGTYTAILSLNDKDNYAWADNTGTNKGISWSIAKKLVQIPVASTTTFTYNGTQKTLSITASGNYTISGNTATNAGTYTAVVSLKDKENCAWTDNSIANKTISWRINKAQSSIHFNASFDPTKERDGLAVSAPTASDYTKTGDGTVSVEWYQKSGANYVAIDGNVAPVNVGEYKVKVVLPQTQNYIGSFDEREFEIFEDVIFRVNARYNISGKGLVLTGILRNGIIHVGDTLEFVCGEDRFDVVVNGIEVNNHSVTSQSASTQEIALLIDGVSYEDIDLTKVTGIYTEETFRQVSYNVHFTMYTKEQGGRHTPVFNDYTPTLKNETLHITETVGISFDEEFLSPGGEYDIVVTFPLPLKLEAGTELQMVESSKVVGIVTIVSMVDEEA